MRIWDIDPGYLNRQSLLGEHRELHGMVSIFVNNKSGYSQHPETLRWVGRGWALKQRHRLLACEMALRGYVDKSPVRTRSGHGLWPTSFIDEPGQQIRLLKQKYIDKEPGRIPLPRNAQQLWSHHKYSVLARDQNRYRGLGRALSTKSITMDSLAMELVELLRVAPDAGGIRNALLHMWGHVSDDTPPPFDVTTVALKRLLKEIQHRAVHDRYISHSTALAELMAWC